MQENTFQNTRRQKAICLSFNVLIYQSHYFQYGNKTNFISGASEQTICIQT